MSSFVIVNCPVCRSAGIAHLGEPPAHDHFRNRCFAHQLQGVRGKGHSAWISDSYFRPKRKNGCCGAPLTWPDGEIVSLLPLSIYKPIVSQQRFLVKDLWGIAYADLSAHLERSPESAVSLSKTEIERIYRIENTGRRRSGLRGQWEPRTDQNLITPEQTSLDL